MGSAATTARRGVVHGVSLGTEIHRVFLGAVVAMGCGGVSDRPPILGLVDAGEDAAVVSEVDAGVVPALVPGGTCALPVSLPLRLSLQPASAPVTLVDALPHANEVAVDATSVYWTDYLGGSIHRADRDGGHPTVLASSEPLAEGLSIDQGVLYWMMGDFDHAALRSMPAAGGTPVTLGRARRAHPTELLHHRITFDEANVYWADIGDETFMNGSIYRVPKVGGTPVALVSGLHAPTSIASDRCNLYWITLGEDAAPGDSIRYVGEVSAMPLAGGPVQVLARSQINALDIAVDGSWVYWSVRGPGPQTGTIQRLAKAGGAPQQLARNLFLPPHLALDDRFLYTLDEGVLAIAIAGRQTRELVSLPFLGGGNGLTVDASGAFFTHQMRGGVSAVSFLPLSP